MPLQLAYGFHLRALRDGVETERGPSGDSKDPRYAVISSGCQQAVVMREPADVQRWVLLAEVCLEV
jgi:hypothetical protein